MATLGREICLETANAEIGQHHHMMNRAKPYIVGKPEHPGPPQTFYGREKNAFWFTRDDINIFWKLLEAGTITHVMVVLGSHPEVEDIPDCPDIAGYTKTSFDPGSQTAILAGTNREPLLKKEGELQFLATGPYVEYPTQGYVNRLNP